MGLPPHSHSFSANIPLKDGTSFTLPLSTESPLFVVGPNGSGKSSLMQMLYRMNTHTSVRVSAHRQTWMETNAPPFSPHEKRNAETNAKSWDSDPSSRWREINPGTRSGLIISDLINIDNNKSRNIRAELQAGRLAESQRLAAEQTPIEIINEIFASAGINVILSIDTNEAIIARKNLSSPYSIVALSDGERAAFLISGAVLTAPEKSLILIDEPERHMHHSISSSLLANLFARRLDCTFVVSTHELDLPTVFPRSRIVLVRETTMVMDQPVGWDLDIINSDIGIPDEIKIALIGSRRKVLFVEGENQSLDKLLYQHLFPNVSIHARGSCSEVIRSVRNIRDAGSLTWIEAYGIVDQDQLSEERKRDLAVENVFALSSYSVESLYYCEHTVDLIAKRQANMLGTDANDMRTNAWTAFLGDISSHTERLAAHMVEQVVRDKLNSQAINSKFISSTSILQFSLDVQALYKSEFARISALIFTKNIKDIVSRYPIRTTPALTSI